MFNNTRITVTSTSFEEGEENFPFIHRIDYTKDSYGNDIVTEDSYYVNSTKEYYIKVSFNKELYISENAKVRVLFNNNTYIEETISSGKSNNFVVKGNSNYHFEEDLKVVAIDVINGYIKDENGNELSANITEAMVKNEQSLIVINETPVVMASSEKEFYTTNKAYINLSLNESFIGSYCVSSHDFCEDNEFITYENNKIEYEFESEDVENEACVFVKDKAGNISDCAQVKFKYYPYPKLNMTIQEGDVVNTNMININVESEVNNYLNITNYCLTIESEECVHKEYKETINIEKSFSDVEGTKLIKFILFDDAGNSYEFEKSIIYDKTRPVLDLQVSNKESVSNYKEVIINFVDTVGLSNSNVYEYYLSTSNTELVGSKWMTCK